MNFIRTSTF